MIRQWSLTEMAQAVGEKVDDFCFEENSPLIDWSFFEEENM